MNKTIARLVAFLFAVSSLSLASIAPAVAKNSSSLGHGVKCTWVLVSSVNNVNTYKQVCRKGV